MVSSFRHGEDDDHQNEQVGQDVLQSLAHHDNDERYRVDHARNHCIPPRTNTVRVLKGIIGGKWKGAGGILSFTFTITFTGSGQPQD